MAKKPPSKVKLVRRTRNLGDLHNLLLECCPPDDDGNVSITILASTIGVTPWSLYKWIKEETVPPGRVNQLVKLSAKAGNPKKIEDFHRYVF